MADKSSLGLWLRRSGFALIAFAILIVQLVPLDLRPANWTGPDLLLVVTLVWVARRPNHLPTLLIAFIFLMADLFLMRPPGLWTALVVILTETLRRQQRDFRNLPFLAEWGTIAVGIVTITLLHRIILVLAGTTLAPLGLTMMEMVLSILAYPAIALLAYLVFGISRTAPGEVDQMGRKL